MNKISLNSKISLLEIVLSVLLFAAASIIMLSCFGIARYTQIRANDKAIAGAIIQSEFEIIKSLNNTNEMHEFLDSSYETKELGNSEIFIKYYDDEWIQGNGNEYVLSIVLEYENFKSGELLNINISAEKEKPYPFIKKGEKNIYSIESKKFFAFGGQNGE